MIRRLPSIILQLRSEYFRAVREYFFSQGLTETETPLLNPHGNFDPFIDPIRIMRSFPEKSPQAEDYPESFRSSGYLITSPEYNLKTILPDSEKGVFQIAHSFREGDTGTHHSVEFLMLEWYRKGCDHIQLIQETFDLIKFIKNILNKSFPFLNPDPLILRPETVTVPDLFSRYCPGYGFENGIYRESLEKCIFKEKLLGPGENAEQLRFDELFFSIFLNRIEPFLITEHPLAVKDYPRELRANARLTPEGNAARFEVYWKGIELCNGYFEETDPQEQIRIFQEDNRLRKLTGREEMTIQPSLTESLAELYNSGIPVSGNAMGLDRLLMILTGSTKLSEISPFY